MYAQPVGITVFGNRNLSFCSNVYLCLIGVLTFTNVPKEAAGMYACVALADGKVINATIRITVGLSPSITSPPQNLTGKSLIHWSLQTAMKYIKGVMTWAKVASLVCRF